MSVLVQLNKPSRDFEMIPRRLCRLGLSAEAVGLLVIVACAPEGRKIDAAWIEAETGFRRDKRQLVMRELVAAGLLLVQPEQGADGRWSKLYVFDWDILLVAPRPDKPASVHRGRIYRRRQIRSSRSTDFPVIEDRETETAAAPAAPQRAKRAQAALSEVGNTREAAAVDKSLDAAAPFEAVQVAEKPEGRTGSGEAGAGARAERLRKADLAALLGQRVRCPDGGEWLSAAEWRASRDAAARAARSQDAEKVQR